MINRTYFVSLPTTQRTIPAFVDICVHAPMGTRTLPVANPVTYGAGNVTTPPVGWTAACGDAGYYELRGRTLPFEHLFAAGAAGGFTQRLNLGFVLSVSLYGNWQLPTPTVQLSQSLLAAVGGDTGGVIPATNLADPVYGVAQPVIRVYSPTNALQGLLTVINFSIAERKDEDFSGVGGV